MRLEAIELVKRVCGEVAFSAVPLARPDIALPFNDPAGQHRALNVGEWSESRPADTKSSQSGVTAARACSAPRDLPLRF